jgi:hypothetical protein
LSLGSFFPDVVVSSALLDEATPTLCNHYLVHPGDRCREEESYKQVHAIFIMQNLPPTGSRNFVCSLERVYHGVGVLIRSESRMDGRTKMLFKPILTVKSTFIMMAVPFNALAWMDRQTNV